MTYKEFYSLLYNNHLISPIWISVADLVETTIKDKEHNDIVLSLLLIYFSLIDDGNTCMSLDKDKLKSKWNKKINGIMVSLSEKDDFDSNIFEEIKKESLNIINQISILSDPMYSCLFDSKSLFYKDEEYIYTRKYFKAKLGIEESIKRLFNNYNNKNTSIDYSVFKSFELADRQKLAVEKGLNNNIIITGGPGTGKTTSIIFILIALLKENIDKHIYLTAPSGKASSRMKESIINSMNGFTEKYKEENKEIFNKIANSDNYTIHRLLEIDYNTNFFKYHKENRFPEDSIFIIDEASMIDIEMFNNLLQAIPDDARVFIMGDKNQLPSVDSGAVLTDLLSQNNLKDFIVELDQSNRFKKGTSIYNLAESINNGDTLPINDDEWLDPMDIKIVPYVNKSENKIFYYKDTIDNVKDKELVEHVYQEWARVFYNTIQKDSYDIDFNEYKFKELNEIIETSKILAASNDGNRGINNINNIIHKNIINKKDYESYHSHYTGEILMVSKNNKVLDLYNGDTGITVKFKDDDCLYVMFKKNSEIIKVDGKSDSRIFKQGSFVFYPIFMISNKEIGLAYAITIHKSQGSDYKNILVVLPNKLGHPLVNRQIVYTAITRTKGNTFILSNLDRLNESKDTVLTRDTNIRI